MERNLSYINERSRMKTPDKLAISFSGGRTSAVMTKLLLERFPGAEIIVTFANTGCEHPNTLDFVKACDDHWDFSTVWLEAKVHEEHGKGNSFRVVDYETASRNGKPFMDFVRKYGIPNQITPNCTGKLKEIPMVKYLATRGFIRGKGLNYDTAIGIRADEMDRVSKHRARERFIYPLVEWGWDKGMVLDYMSQFDWDLDLPGEHLGNCVWCWKKSRRKLMTLAKEHPWVFDFPLEMDKLYSTHKADAASGHNGRRTCFRGHLDTKELIELAHKTDFVPYRDRPREEQLRLWDTSLDEGNGCGGSDSCEAIGTEGWDVVSEILEQEEE